MSKRESILSAPYFHNEAAAYEFVEARLWPQGPVCPKCGVIGNSAKLQGKSTRVGVYKCRDCRKPFRVTVGTIFEASHIPLNIWLQAIFLVASSKKGMSSNQLHRSLDISLKSAWFMSHRIREAMRGGDFALLGADGVIGVALPYTVSVNGFRVGHREPLTEYSYMGRSQCSSLTSCPTMEIPK